MNFSFSSVRMITKPTYSMKTTFTAIFRYALLILLGFLFYSISKRGSDTREEVMQSSAILSERQTSQKKFPQLDNRTENSSTELSINLSSIHNLTSQLVNNSNMNIFFAITQNLTEHDLSDRQACSMESAGKIFLSFYSSEKISVVAILSSCHNNYLGS